MPTRRRNEDTAITALPQDAKLSQVLDAIAQRGSWFGGGTAAALSAALAASLLEKLVHQPATAARLRRARRRCLALMQEDAQTFALVIQATRARDQQRFVRALKAAIEVPCQIAEHAAALEAACRATQRVIKPQWQSDLRCARALAQAADAGARALIHTNLRWLHDAAHTRSVERRLRAARALLR